MNATMTSSMGDTASSTEAFPQGDYLNTNALQQLHTYFISTLPRPYDRGLISNTFMIDRGMLERTLEFAPGEWL
ncbi:MAG: ATPase, partial [Candidatus Bathyarchaeota archaeon B23]